MSITNSLYIGISGLAAHGDAIGVVGDNIANTSTVGFKRARASFNDMLGGELGAQRLGGGVRLGGTQTMWDQGSITQSGNPLDVAISGGGLFVVRGNHKGQEGEFYTRDGRFQFDKQGMIVDSRGLKVQGFMIDTAGNRSTAIGDLPLGAHQSPPVATTGTEMVLNLDSNAVPPANFLDSDPQGTSNYATSVTVYDSLGNSHAVSVYFRHQGGGNWEWHAMVDDADLGGPGGTPTQIADGTMAFDATGKLLSQSTASSDASFVGAEPNQAITFNFGDDISSGGTGLSGTTQYAGASTVNAIDVDGHSSGNLTDLRIAEDGTIQGIFDNGDRRDLAQLALADFPSLEGLDRAGDGLVVHTAASGSPVIDVPGTGSRGSVVSGAIEGSNVDLGTELVTLIAFQRAFQANAKTVTTADEMMAEVANLKR